MISVSILILIPAYLLILLFVFRKKKTGSNVHPQEIHSLYRIAFYFFLLLLIIGFISYYIGTAFQKISYSNTNTFLVLPNSSIWIVPCLFLALPIVGYLVRYIHLVDSKTQYRSMIHWMDEHTGLYSQKVANWFLLPLFIASVLLFILTINWHTCILIDQQKIIIGSNDSFAKKQYSFNEIAYFGCEDKQVFPEGRARIKPYYKITFSNSDEWDLRGYQLEKEKRNSILDKISHHVKVPIEKCE